jgi:hypothetical protein
MHANEMKRLLRIFELSNNEQRVVLIVMLMLIMIAFVGYERRVHHRAGQLTSGMKTQPSPTPVEMHDDQ